MEAQTESQLDAFPQDARVWVIVDKNDPGNHLLFPGTIDYVMGLYAFIEQRDAEHLVRSLKKAGQFEDKDLGIRYDLLSDLRSGARESQTPLWVLDNKAAMDFFTRYPDNLDSYYGY
jgi:hypothetical protein